MKVRTRRRTSSSASTRGICGSRISTSMLREGSHQERVLEQVQVVRNRFEGSALLELSLQLLERDDLGRRGDADPEDLPEQGRSPERAKESQVW